MTERTRKHQLAAMQRMVGAVEERSRTLTILNRDLMVVRRACQEIVSRSVLAVLGYEKA